MVSNANERYCSIFIVGAKVERIIEITKNILNQTRYIFLLILFFHRIFVPLHSEVHCILLNNVRTRMNVILSIRPTFCQSIFEGKKVIKDFTAPQNYMYLDLDL